MAQRNSIISLSMHFIELRDASASSRCRSLFALNHIYISIFTPHVEWKCYHFSTHIDGLEIQQLFHGVVLQCGNIREFSFCKKNLFFSLFHCWGILVACASTVGQFLTSFIRRTFMWVLQVNLVLFTRYRFSRSI